MGEEFYKTGQIYNLLDLAMFDSFPAEWSF